MADRRFVAAAVALLVVWAPAGCGHDAGREGTVGQPAASAAAQTSQGATSAPPTTAPAPLAPTPTAVPTTTTTEPQAGRDPTMPWGARHGDQAEIVDEFGTIAAETDCDVLVARRDGYAADEQQMMATRVEQGHRAQAEHDDRWEEAVDRRLVELGCVDLADTP